MRRASDAHQGQRTGLGRRARDLLATGTAVSPRLRGPQVTTSALFLGEDLREASLALAGIEAYVVQAHRALAEPLPGVAELRALVDDREVGAHLELLADAVASLRQALGRLADERDPR
jgi:hypothetical protein